MNILIIGGTGFIGSNFIKNFSNDVKIFSISSKPHQFFEENKNVKYIYADWRFFDYYSFLIDNSIEAVIHLSWGSHPRSSNLNLLSDFKSTVQPTIDIIDIISKIGNIKYIFASSFGALGSSDENIDHSPSLDSGYASGKMAVESYIKLYVKVENLNAIIFRISNPYGPYQDPHGTQGIIPIFTKKIIKNENFEFFPDAYIKKNYIYIDDVTKALFLSLFSKEETKLVYDLGSECYKSAFDIYIDLNYYFGNHEIDFPLASKYDSELDCNSRVNIKYNKSDFSWEPNTQFDLGLKMTVKWIRHMLGEGNE
ncbi:hypothetical protein OAS_16805 [Vibrio cyclitrophicus ZF65]|uniref:NAD-dependent epimerase/dehydratase family protein n=1 Tax=Vibrio cyclitrophicus TaxID=47951 RepID=UPI0002D86402|nr:NAD-dependent epimerase/dehydratase family protein [Vibrio cyclitrophicus]OED75342.1 hypothetical protein OAS_16805 [Vibrio cyclitrophicus ZF65]PMJ76503.1 hypothetical protein BCU15_02495 [Vibrio cyclitrophicus]